MHLISSPYNSTCMNIYKRGGVILNQELVDELVKLRDDGWEYKQLSEFFGVDRTTLWKLYTGLQAPSGKIETNGQKQNSSKA